MGLDGMFFLAIDANYLLKIPINLLLVANWIVKYASF
jgi:hypothetical protein